MRPLNAYLFTFSPSFLVSLGLVLTLGLSQQTHAFHFDGKQLYTEASLQGEYAYVAIGEGSNAPEGEIGVYHFDGLGSGSCENVLSNQPQESPQGPQAQLPNTVGNYSCTEVTYTIRSPDDPPDFPDFPQPLPQQNGTGTMTIKFTPDDSEAATQEFTLDFAIAKTERIYGRKIATEISFIRQDLTEAGNLVTGVFKRRPTGRRTYSNASLQGTYRFSSVGRYGDTPQARLGIVYYDGKGTGSGFAIANFNEPSDDPNSNEPGERSIFRGNLTDGFEVNEDGTGTFFFEPEKESLYAAVVITEAKKIRGKLIATEISFLNFFRCCAFPEAPFLQPGNNFTTSIATRISD